MGGKKKRITSILAMLMTLSISLTPAFAFAAEELANGSTEGTNTKEITESEKIEAEASESTTDSETTGNSTITFSVSGNGSYIVKPYGGAEESNHDVQEGRDYTADANIGDQFTVKTYPMDGNAEKYDLENVEKVSETALNDKNKEVVFKVTGGSASIKISFEGGLGINDGNSLGGTVSRLLGARPVLRAAASSMTIKITKSKVQYGYDASGNGLSFNKYGKFTSDTSGVYGGAVYCAEHDRNDP